MKTKPTCPECGGTHIHKQGTTTRRPEGKLFIKQKWLCLDCGRNFSTPMEA